MRFNAPPGWPQPPADWTPPPGWSPDPTWGPAPDGWQFWVDDADFTEHDPATQLIDARPLGTGPEERATGGTEQLKTQHTSRKRRRILPAVGAVVLFVSGIGIGAAVTDPTTSDDYLALASANADLEADHEVLQADYATMSSGLEDTENELREREDAVKASEEALQKREDEVKEAESAVKKREEAVSGAEKEKAENTIREGTWTVGVDIAPGTYRTTADVGSRCYWAILATGTNGDDIIANDIPGGGRPSVTLSEGQDFETSTCGTWEMQ